MEYPYNPAHAIGTCALCGQEMCFNVPRLGPNGGYIHKETGAWGCATQEGELSIHVHVELPAPLVTDITPDPS